MKRGDLILKIMTVLETSSDTQLILIDKAIRELLGTEEWGKNSARESKNFTNNGNPVFEDVEEGNYGTLYRSPETI